MDNKPVDRDSITKIFLPDHIGRSTCIPHNMVDYWVKLILGTDEIDHIPDLWVKEKDKEDPQMCARFKQGDFYGVYFRYSRVFDLCRVIGAANLYDIGCQTVNQSFLLTDRYTTMSYTGITNDSFDMIDFQDSDIEEGYYDIITTKQTPAPLCDGRIRFIKGHYPNFPLEVQPNNIAIACHSLTMCSTEEKIARTADALSHDFERVLFDVSIYKPERIEWWKKQDWHGFEFYPIGSGGFVFGTKNPEDIQRMKVMYPFEDGRFITGIGDFYPSGIRCDVPRDKFERYVDWN